MEIHHVLIERKDAKLNTNVKLQRGAIGETDHYMVNIRLKQEIPREKKNNRESRDTKCRNCKATKYSKLIQANSWDQNSNQSIEKDWKPIEYIVVKAAKHIFKMNKLSENKEWFDE